VHFLEERANPQIHRSPVLVQGEGEMPNMEEEENDRKEERDEPIFSTISIPKTTRRKAKDRIVHTPPNQSPTPPNPSQPPTLQGEMKESRMLKQGEKSSG